MNYRLIDLKRRVIVPFCLAALITGGLTSCHDDYDLDDEGNYPSWLGESIYEELQNPDQEQLTGTFTNYLRLIDDLGYTETLKTTGSKTVFPANDEAFNRFYADNTWGVTKYEDLSTAQKKLLLYSSMLDNAILVEMLSNVSASSTSVSSGIAMKHQTNVNVIDTITHVYGVAGLPRNNSYWTKYYDSGIDMVMDATRPMMVHFTAEQMTANNITTTGSNSDFAVITGTEYNDSANTAYIFRDRIINPDVTCQNGYIHQMEDVIVPPGNLAEMLRTSGESNYFSRMLDRFSAPYYNGTVTNNYNDWAITNGATMIDSIFEKRYFSERSQGNSSLSEDPNGNSVNTDLLLPYDPGWNQYQSAATGVSSLSDIAAMFVPTDAAMEEYFLPGGEGSFLIDQYGSLPNTQANLMENIDSIPQEIVQAFLSMLMKSSFIATVPSKFDNVMNDSEDPMGLSLSDLNVNDDGTYDVKIANNGVAYMLNTVYAPNRYVAVSAPALLSDNMKVMNWGIQDKTGSGSGLNLNFYAYLLAMDANYAFFIPTDDAFDCYYVDPVYLKRSPRVLHFYYDPNSSPNVRVSAFDYDPDTHEIGTDSTILSFSRVATQFKDILNTHTVILDEGEVLGTNHYYKTKNGGEIYVSANAVGGEVKSGAQIDGSNPLDPSTITKIYTEKNGQSFAIDHIIQMPTQSVYSVLSSNSQFSEFFDLCNDSRLVDIANFAGISSTTDNTHPIAPVRQYQTFIDANGYHGLDYDVSYFSSYNYTVYAPDNDAMEKAYDLGLPRWDDLEAIYNEYNDAEDSPARQQAQAQVYAMIEAINNFIRYHFQNNSVYADNTVEDGEFNTACSDTLGIASKLYVENGGNNQFQVRDESGQSITISTSSGLMVNQMSRDLVFDATATSATTLQTSSFAVIHEISTPLNYQPSGGRYDTAWNTTSGKRSLIAHRKAGLARLNKKYSR